jgi:hypothetical protein
VGIAPRKTEETALIVLPEPHILLWIKDRILIDTPYQVSVMPVAALHIFGYDV